MSGDSLLNQVNCNDAWGLCGGSGIRLPRLRTDDRQLGGNSTWLISWATGKVPAVAKFRQPVYQARPSTRQLNGNLPTI